MDDNFEELVIDVRATTDGFAADLDTMRTSLDISLLDGFEKAGNVLERSLLSALRKGSLGFDDLKKIALRSLDEIASHALQSSLGSLGGGSDSGLGGLIGQSLGSLFGLPGRATGGPVSPGRGYVVGEAGPEIFVPTSSGRIESNAALAGGQGRDVRVAIQLASPRGTAAPVAMQRSSRQVASAVRRALQNS
ncbi:MAG: tail tape measure protein [Pseudomonadota bacterium]